MASRKRARTSSTGGGSSDSTAAAQVELDGGEPCPSGLVKLWRSGRMMDTVVEVEGRSFAAHKNVLAAQCDYFNRHYDHEHMRDADHPKLLEHVTAAAFEPVLAFLYEGKCTFDESLLLPVLRAAHYLNVAPLERAAVSALTERLSPSNALTAWTWGEELELPELTEAAKESALKGFDEVEKIEEATLLQMQSLVADDHLNAKSEEVVFSAVARFAEAKQPAEADLLALLRNVRFAQMSKEFLHGTVRTWPMIQTVAGKDLLLEVFMPLLGPTLQPRLGFGARFLYVMGGSTREVGIYDPQADTWSAGTPMATSHSSGSADVLNGKIYMMGGAGAGKTVEVFDSQTGSWAAVAPMAASRVKFAAATCGGKIYAIGGNAGNAGSTRLSSAEAFDPRTGAWAEVAPMAAPRSSPGAAALDGKIYVIGGVIEGTVSSNVTDSMQVYDPQTKTWAAGPPMASGRLAPGVAALGGKIYAVGGYNATAGGAVSVVEAFDPQTNSWAAVAPMSTERYYFSLTPFRGRLYAAGGSGSAAQCAVEVYDPQQNRWDAVAPMANARSQHCAVAL